MFNKQTLLPIKALLLGSLAILAIFARAENAFLGAIPVDHDVYAFVRAHLDDRVAVVLNRGKTEAQIDINVAPELSDGDYTDALSGKKISVGNGKLNFTLPAQSAAFITKPR